MKFNMMYPVLDGSDTDAWIKPRNISRFAQTMEAAGLSGLGFTDHPAPSRKWLDAGGHASFDPYAALCFCAAVTTRLTLMTHLAVVPYRNPLLQARSMMTVDVLSAGRATFVLGVGYLRSEFAALGVDFEERNALFDEAIEVITGVWREKVYSFEGLHFTAVGQAMVPTVVQKPHPPLWLGGNSKRTLDRIAKWGQGWSVLFATAEMAQTSRTPPITNEGELGAALKDLDERLAVYGRKLSDVDIEVGSPATDLTNRLSTHERIDRLSAMREIGVTWARLTPPTVSVDAGCDAVSNFIEMVAPHIS